jgi:hypothetical protein
VTLLLLSILAADGGSGNFLNCQARQATLDDGGVSWLVTVLQSPLPNDAARASKQPEFGRAGFPVDDVLTIQGKPFMHPIRIDGTGYVQQVTGVVVIADAGTLNINPPVSLPLPTGAATSALQDSGNTSLSSIDAQLALIKAKTDNIDVAFSTRTKPADQQHVIIDSSASIAVTGTFWQSTQPVSAAALPLPSGAATDATLSMLLDGGVAIRGQTLDGTIRPVLLTEGGAQWVKVLPGAAPNALLLPCNAVRRSNCR